ncbi:hypothetical protein MQA_02813 [Staphylococcus aureus subsp. aureus VRS1]|nr:hypothetical protein MQA_02813 [Staphylococcus aureus subsp. aureus VRS1]
MLVRITAMTQRDTKEIEDVYKKAQAFDEILEGLPNAMQDALKEDIELDEAVGIMTGQVVYKYEEEQEDEKI